MHFWVHISDYKIQPAKWFVAARLLFLFTMLIAFRNSYSQNLVYNGDFEIGQDQCDFTLDNSSFPYFMWGWYTPTSGTSDTFTTQLANPACYAQMPYTGVDRYQNFPHIGSILPRSGNRFVGIFTYDNNTIYDNNPPTGGWREYVQGTLTTPLVPDTYYCVEFYTAVAGRPRFAANNLGVYFCEAYDYRGSPWPLPFTPQVLETRIITESNWVRVAKIFKATSPATKLIIGNFFADSVTQAIDKGGFFPEAVGYNAAFYFIDDVSVYPIIEKPFRFRGDTIICQNETANVTAEGGMDNIKWTTLTDTLAIITLNPTLSVKPGITTSYRVTGKNCGLFVADTVTITVNPVPQIELGAHETFCNGNTVVLDAGEGFQQYTWSNGHTGRYLDVSNTGTYGVQVTNEFNCSASDFKNLTRLDVPKVNLGPDTVVCDALFLLKVPGKYQVVTWSTGLQDSVFVPTSGGVYWAIAENQCGMDRDTISIYTAADYFVPNVVTANGDDVNDEFKIVIKPLDATLPANNEVEVALCIWDRWGVKVFEDRSYKTGWPGNQPELSAGVYYFEAALLDCRIYKGWIQVIR